MLLYIKTQKAAKNCCVIILIDLFEFDRNLIDLFEKAVDGFNAEPVVLNIDFLWWRIGFLLVIKFCVLWEKFFFEFLLEIFIEKIIPLMLVCHEIQLKLYVHGSIPSSCCNAQNGGLVFLVCDLRSQNQDLCDTHFYFYI